MAFCRFKLLKTLKRFHLLPYVTISKLNRTLYGIAHLRGFHLLPELTPHKSKVRQKWMVTVGEMEQAWGEREKRRSIDLFKMLYTSCFLSRFEGFSGDRVV